MLITSAELYEIAPNANAEIVSGILEPLNLYLPQYNISTVARVAMFLAQWCEETDGFKTMYEYASGREYEGRKDLGNIQPGDGPKFKGRGLAQLTGRDNYALYGKLLGLDLVNNPDLAADNSNAVQIACVFWQRHSLNAWADKGDVKQCTFLINGGENGLAVRQRNYDALYLIFHQLGSVPEAPPVPLPRPGFENVSYPVPQSSAPIATNPTPALWQTPEGNMFGMAAISQVGMIVTGASGPIMWLLCGVIVLAVGVGLFYLWKRLHKGQ